MITRRTPLAAILLAACSSPAGPSDPARPPAPDTVPTPEFEGAGSDLPAPVTLEDPGGALAPLYRAFAAAEAGDAVDGRVLIAQFGDSHTAGDKMTGQLRKVLQARFGDGGRGFVLPGRPPLRHYSPGDLRYGTDGAWKVAQGWGSRDGGEPFGINGVRSYATSSSATAWVATCPDCASGTAVERFELFFLRQKDGGVLEVQIDDGEWTRVHTALGRDQGDAPVLDYTTLEVADGAHRLTLRPRKGGKEVGVFGVAMERGGPGAVVDALGIVGLQMSHLWSWDWTVVGAQLAHRDPALVVLQYGTNEVDDDDLDLARFEERFVELVERIKLAVPDAGILILGPPDMATREHSRKECERLEKKQKKAAQKLKKKGGQQIPEGPPDGCAWTTPPVLHDVVEAERRVAQRTGVAFFDSLRAMGGPDVIDGLCRLDPPLAYQDHVHFTTAGYASWADLLLEDLMRGYAAWQKQSPSKR